MGQAARLLARRPTWLGTLCDALATVFLTADCRLCDQLLLHASRVPICGECLASFRRIAGTICGTCGLPLENMAAVEGEDERCGRCRVHPYAFDRARSFAVYEQRLVKAILLLKFERIEPLGGYFAERLAEFARNTPEMSEADMVVPVPLHRDREKERGHNQAELLSRRLARLLGLPHRGVLLVRTKPRPDKHILTIRERWDAVRGAFATRPGSQVDNRRVLLVDDVMTTGATLDACAKALRAAGAKSVLGLTVARASRSSLQVAQDK
jgi:ComF family protein